MDARDFIAAQRTLSTPRLLLESPRAEHAAAFLESRNASLAQLRFITWGQELQEIEWATRFCINGGKIVDCGASLIFNVFEREGHAYVGRVDLHSLDIEAPRCEVGYVGDSRLAGCGLMREAVLAVMALGFSLGLARIHALSDLRNERAHRFAEQALGMVREGVLRAYERDPQGRLADMVMFAAYNPRAT